MHGIHELLRRLRMLFYRRQFQADLEEEMRLHLELREREQTEAGVAESRRAAYRKLYEPSFEGSTQLSRALPSAAKAQFGWILPGTEGFETTTG